MIPNQRLPWIEIRLVVVESDPADLAVIESVAIEHGFELEIAPVAMLVSTLFERTPDVLISDTQLQGNFDGFSLCRTLKANVRTAAIPFLLMSSQGGPKTHRRAMEVGADDFLEKPFSRSHLALRLRSYAQLRRAAALRDAALTPK